MGHLAAMIGSFVVASVDTVVSQKRFYEPRAQHHTTDLSDYALARPDHLWGQLRQGIAAAYRGICPTNCRKQRG